MLLLVRPVSFNVSLTDSFFHYNSSAGEDVFPLRQDLAHARQ